MLSHLYATLIHAAKISIISERNKKYAKILLVILYLHSFLSVFYVQGDAKGQVSGINDV